MEPAPAAFVRELTATESVAIAALPQAYSLAAATGAHNWANNAFPCRDFTYIEEGDPPDSELFGRVCDAHDNVGVVHRERGKWGGVSRDSPVRTRRKLLIGGRLDQDSGGVAPPERNRLVCVRR